MQTYLKLALPLLLPFASAVDIKQLLVQRAQHYRNMQAGQPTGDLLCLFSALSFGSTTDPTTQEQQEDGVLMQTFGLVLGSDLTAICPDPSSCDLTDSSLYSEAKAICDTAGGQLLTTDFSTCKDTLITVLEGVGAAPADAAELQNLPDTISVSNIPVCLPPAPLCPADFDLFPAIGNTLEEIVASLPPQDDPEMTAAINDVVAAVKDIVEGKDCSSTTGPGDTTTTTSASSHVSSLFVAGVVAVFSSMIIATL